MLHNAGGDSTATVTFTVGPKGDQTITFTSTAPAGAKVGGPSYTVTATATSGLTVTFTIDASASSVCTIAGGSTVSFIGVGTCVIDADQAGDGSWNAAPQVQQTFSVATGDQTISFTSTAPVDATVGGPTYDITATASSGLTVTFTIDVAAASVCSILGSTVSFIGGGTCVIDANQVGDANWNPAPQVQQSFPVTAAPVITSANATSFTSTVPGSTFTVTTSGFPTGASMVLSETGDVLPSAVTFTDNHDGTATIAGTPDAGTQGDYHIVITATNGVLPDATQNFTLTVLNLAPQPIAVPLESFDTVGNVQLQVAAGASLSTPEIFVSWNLLSNFTNVDGPDPMSAVAAAGTTANGGTFDIAADGTFVFTPKPGDAALTDSFPYQVTDGLTPSTIRTVTVNLKSRTWFVKNDAAAGGFGRSNDPFDTLAAAQTASAPGDYIFVYGGSLTNTGQTAGIALKANQKLYGEAYGLPIADTVNGVLNPVLVVANPANLPVIDNLAAGGDGISALNVAGVEIRGVSVSGTQDAIDVTTTAGSGGAIISNNLVRLPGVDGIHVAAGGSGGAMTLAISGNVITGATRGMELVKTAGTLTITDFNGNVITGATTGSGIVVDGAIFDAVPGNPIDTVASGPSAIGASGTPVGLAGMSLINVTGDLSFADLDIYDNGGTGLKVTSTGALNAGAGTGFRVVVAASVGTIDSNNGPAVDVNNASISLPLSFLRSTNSAATGLSLVNAFGGPGGTTLSAASGQISDPGGASGTAVNVNGGNGNVTLGIPITNTSGNAVVVTGRTGDTVSFTGAIGDTGSGMSLTSNTGATISFTGALTVSTGSNPAFTATGGGTVTATDTTSTLTTTTATALNVANTTIGASGLKFRSISAGTGASGPASGIVLNNTGSSGGLSVLGSGSAGSGGTIQHSTGAGISLTSTRDVSLTRMVINHTADSGIKGTTVTNFSFTNGSIDDSGTALGAETANIAFNTTAAGTENNLAGTVTITGNTLTNAYYHGIDIFDHSGTISDATISGNTITSSTSTATSKGTGIRLIAFGSAGGVANVTKATIANNIVSNFPSAAGIMAQGGNGNAAGPAGVFGTVGSGTNVIAITGNRVAGASAANRMGTQAIIAVVNGKGQGNFDISNNGTGANPVGNVIGTAIAVSSFGVANVTANIANNVIVANNINGAQGIGAGTSQTFAATDTPTLTATISNNSISQTDGNGILATARDATGTLNVSIKNNAVAAPLGGVRPGIRVDAGNAISVDDDVCLDMSGNTSAGSGGSQGLGLRKQGTSSTVNAFGVEGMAATASPGVESYIDGQNPAGNGTLLISATSGFSNCSGAP